jgi:hypothetical protein
MDVPRAEEVVEVGPNGGPLRQRREGPAPPTTSLTGVLGVRPAQTTTDP